MPLKINIANEGLQAQAIARELNDRIERDYGFLTELLGDPIPTLKKAGLSDPWASIYAAEIGLPIITPQGGCCCSASCKTTCGKTC